MDIIQAKEYFSSLHNIVCNQKYNKTLPYSFHLDMVVHQANKFISLIPDVKLRPENSFSNDRLRDSIIVACYAHDSIEDARLTYNDIKERCSEEVAEIVYLVTDNKGRDRSERKNDVFYNHLKKNQLAVFVKLCDLIANVKFSLLTNSSMYNKYKAEYSGMKSHLYTKEYDVMFKYLEQLLSIN
jgi:(p)ppGpp synthase/HD superfamily hydrolase